MGQRENSTEISNNRSAVVPVQAGLVGYWRMNGTLATSADTVLDETTNNTDLSSMGAGLMTYIDPGSNGNFLKRPNSFDVYAFNLSGTQIAVDFQWRWKAV